jgi:putative sterol carrier protein
MARIDPIAQFMDGLAASAHEPALAKASGTVRFEVGAGKRTERWLVTVTKGGLEVSRRNARADAVVRASRPLFEQLVQGKANPTAAFLRGALTLEGSLELLVLVQRLFPRPVAAHKKGRVAGGATRKPRK